MYEVVVKIAIYGNATCSNIPISTSILINNETLIFSH
jgi:hypothetical protein